MNRVLLIKINDLHDNSILDKLSIEHSHMAANYLLSHSFDTPRESGSTSVPETWALSYTPDYSKILTACSDGSLYLWPTEKTDGLPADSDSVLVDSSSLGLVGLCVSSLLPNSTTAYYAITNSLHSQISRYDIDGDSFKRSAQCFLKPGTSYSSALHPDSSASILVTSGSQGSVSIVSTSLDNFGEVLHVLPGKAGRWGKAMAYSSSGKHFALATDDGHLSIFDSAEHTLWQTFPAHSRSIRTVTFSPDSTLLASGGDDKIINIYDLRSSPGKDAAQRQPAKGHHVAALSHHKGWIESLDFKPDGRILASGASDGFIRLYDMRNFSSPLATLRDHTGDVWSLKWQPERFRSTVSAHEGTGGLNQIGTGRFASAGQDGLLRVWRGTGST